ncbi:acyltransferase [Verrucomicrobiota bacterium]
MSDIYSKAELMDMGFDKVGDDVAVSRDTRLFAIQGSLGDGVRIDAFSILTGNIILGNHVHVSPFCFLAGTGGKITMGNYSGIASHVSIFTKSADYRTLESENTEKVKGDVSIGEYSIIGSGTRIMPDITISEHVNIGCNCIVNHNIEKDSILVSRGTGLVTVSKR